MVDGSLAVSRTVATTGDPGEQPAGQVHAEKGTADRQAGQGAGPRTAAHGQQLAPERRTAYDEADRHGERGGEQHRVGQAQDPVGAEREQGRVEDVLGLAAGDHERQAAAADQQRQRRHDRLHPDDRDEQAVEQPAHRPCEQDHQDGRQPAVPEVDRQQSRTERCVITDERADPGHLRRLQDAGVAVIIAAPSQSSTPTSR